MQISLIVCTRNRASRLPDFLARISALDFPPDDWELILVDHASTDDTPSVLETFAASAPFCVQRTRSAARALTEAKNEAIARTRGEIVAFTDDDCYPRPDYLRALVEVFAEHDVGVVGGRVVLHDPTDAKVSIRDVDRATVIEPESFVPAGLIHGANMAVRRDVVRDIGGFDPLFGPGTPCVAGEDVEYISRAIRAGWRGRYDPRPVVAHHHGRKPGRDAEQHRRGYDYGRGAYYTKLLMDSRARRRCLREWYEGTRRAPRNVAAGRLLRELAGGRRYLMQRALRPRPIPRFPHRATDASWSSPTP